MKVMRLAEAILLGSVNSPQAFGELKDMHTQGTCALGAAMEAVGIEINGLSSSPYGDALKLWPYLDSLLQVCPICGFLADPLNFSGPHMIPHLNDKHRLTRPEIAEIVRQAEDKLFPSDPTPVCIEETITLELPVPTSGR
jgi:hypothetical protein